MHQAHDSLQRSPEISFPFDHPYSNDNDIKESFLIFSSRVYELDQQLNQFATTFQRLGRVAGLLLAIKRLREMLKRTREVFFHNATALVPDMFEQARKVSEQFHISSRYFSEYAPTFVALPMILEDLATSFRMLYARIDDFRESTDEGLLLKSLLLTLDRDLMYRASCAKFYTDRLNTPPIQRYIHQFVNDLQVSFEKVTVAIGEYTKVGIPAVIRELEKSSSIFASYLAISSFFSGVTATTLQMSTSVSDQNTAIRLTNVLWLTSLIFSAGAALNCLLALAWNATESGSRGRQLPRWVSRWIDKSQLLFLGIAIVTFSTGLIVFAFASSQASYAPYVAVVSTAVTFIGLVAVVLWVSYEILVSPDFKRKAYVIKSSGDSVCSESSKMPSTHAGFASAFKHALPFLRSQSRDDLPQDDVEKVEENCGGHEDSITLEHNSPDQQRTKLQGGVKRVGIMKSALDALSAAGQKKKRPQSDRQQQSKPKFQNDSNSATIPPTALTLPDKPSSTMEFPHYGTIHDVAYSDNGKWLAVTCAKTFKSWTGAFDAETLTIIMDTWHEGWVTSEYLKWSPSGKKLIVKFEYRFDVWNLAARRLYVIERHHPIQDVTWFGEDAFLVADHHHVFNMNLKGQVMAMYCFEYSHIRSIGLERRNNYLVLITRIVQSPEQFKPATWRSEKRVVIYDMDKREETYQVPVLEDISCIYPIADEHDILVTHKDQKAFQLWSLDAGIKGAEIAAKLKKRSITPHDSPGDYIGPTCIGGNYNQFVLNITSSGGIDVWHRESGMPYQRFRSSVLEKEGVHCLSWRRSNDETATFATAGIDSHTLLVWHGEELLLPKASESFGTLNQPSSKFAGSGESSNRWHQAVHAAAVSSSGSSMPWERTEETISESNPRGEH